MPKERQDSRCSVFPRLLIQTDRISYIADVEFEKKALHEAVEIKYFYSGSSTLLIGDKTIVAQAGDVVIINPYEFHATIGNGKRKGRYHMMIVPLEYFSGDMADDLNLKQMLLEKRIRFKNLVKANAFIKNCVLRIMEEHSKKQSFHHMIIRSLVLELFGLLLREGGSEQNKSSLDLEALRSHQSIEPALRHIRDNYHESISVEQLAKQCQLSKYYFCRLFKTVMGKTVMDYLREYRMKIAYSMLGSTDKSVARIAEECGFPDDNYFCRCFKSYYGMSPGKHREESKKEI